MRKLIPYMAVLMAVSLAFLGSACSKNNRNQTAANRSETNLKDSDVQTVIKDRLNADPQLRAADLGVKADIDNHDVKLSGTVDSEEMRSRAIQIAKSAMPGFTISDTVDVKPGSMARATYDNESGNQQDRNQGNASDDSIRSEIKVRLSRSNMGDQDIKVDVDKGVVTLRGNVASESAKSQIQKEAQGVKGVKRVDNKLQVSASQNRNMSDQPAPSR